jgi:hypothetical protein
MSGITSNFATDNSLDTSTTLFAGKEPVSTPVLTAELSDIETEEFFVDDSSGAPNIGFAAIEDEIIFYKSRLRKTKILYLERGINGTTPATHAIGTPVTFTPIYYIPPAFVSAIIEMQTLILDHKDRIEALETP